MENFRSEFACPGQKPPYAESPSLPFGRNIDMPWMSVEDWCQRVTRNLTDPARDNARLVFMGDSITEAWPHSASDIWQQYVINFQALCLGIGGDQTQHLLWRLASGEVDQLSPEVLVLLIGVNNIGYGDWSECETAAGIEAVLHDLRERLPDTEILHLAIFPAGEQATDPFRQKIQRTNELLKNFRIPGVSFLDLGDAFLEEDQSISTDVMYDYLHPTKEGYRRWATALDGELSMRLAKKS
ncbi:MAG: GDSL-type esterase/lipase family protein [Oligoflexus sp.]